MARCYTPPDYIALLDAIRLFAESADTDVWKSAPISSIESDIWNGLDTKWNPEFIEDHLRIQVKAHRQAMIDRLISFDRARAAIRNALCSGRLIGCAFKDNGREANIDAYLWRNTNGELIIRKGTGWFDESSSNIEVCRCVFLKKSEITFLLAAEMSEQAQEQTPAAPTSPAAARRVVANFLRMNRAATRAQAKDVLRAAGLSVTGNQFQTAIWPQAREAANLTRKAKAGKKPAKPDA